MEGQLEKKIVESFGKLSQGKGGWSTELNLVSWGGRDAKYDLRSWSEDHEKMSKGITLTKDEIKVLRELLNKMEL